MSSEVVLEEEEEVSESGNMMWRGERTVASSRSVEQHTLSSGGFCR